MPNNVFRKIPVKVRDFFRAVTWNDFLGEADQVVHLVRIWALSEVVVDLIQGAQVFRTIVAPEFQVKFSV
jgi:hypothetical protein